MTDSSSQFVTNKFTVSFDALPSRGAPTAPGFKSVTQASKFAPDLSNSRQGRNLSQRPANSSPTKSQPQKYYASLTEKQRTEAYFDLYDQNLQLRSQKNELEAQVKKLTTQLVRLTKDIGPLHNTELEEQNEALLKENKALKAKITAKPSRPGTAVARKTPQVQARVIEKPQFDYEKDLKEREEIIALLRDQLEATEVELLRSRTNKVEIPDLSQEYKEKAYRLAEVENKFYSLEEALEAQKIYLQHVLSVLEETQTALKEERFKNCEMEVRLKAAEMAAAGAQELAYKLRDSENEKMQLEARIKEIIEAYFELEAGKGDNPPNLPSAGVARLPL